MKIQKISISEINPAPYNPRVDLKPGDPDYEKLKQSMATFGYVEPLVFNQRTKTLISGHQRLKILIEQGVKETECSVVDLSLEEEKALNLALNKIRGEWDEDKLAVLLEELKKIPDFNLNLTGFDSPEISQILDRYSEQKDGDDFDFGTALELAESPVTKEGDLIELGPHRLFCGDSSNPDHVKRLLADIQVNLLHTDPPYNVDYYGGNRPNASSRPAKHKLWDRIYSDNMTQEQYEEWLRTVLINVAPYFAAGAPIYSWNGHRQFGPMHQMLKELGFHVSCILTWEKESFSLGFGDYNQQTEFCLYGWKNENGAHLWYGPNNESTLWKIHRDPTKTYFHPTTKPVGLPQRAIKNSSKRGDVVLDLFLGSGSTLIAAESLDRRCLGVEIDPRYCDAIVRRYIAFVGQENVSAELRQRYLKEEAHVTE
jgi:DNA modification methylase